MRHPDSSEQEKTRHIPFLIAVVLMLAMMLYQPRFEAAEIETVYRAPYHLFLVSSRHFPELPYFGLAVSGQKLQLLRPFHRPIGLTRLDDEALDRLEASYDDELKARKK